MDMEPDTGLQDRPAQVKIEADAKSYGIPTKLIAKPLDKLSINDLLSHLLHVEAKDITLKWVFDHLRNYGICGLVMWAGLKGLRLPSVNFIDSSIHILGGAVLVATAFVLLALNLIHGITGFSKIRNLGTVGKVAYVVGSLLLFFAAQILFVTAKS